jgi:monothiol glutaredoxin
MDVIERIQQQLADNSVILYMKGTPDFPQCGFSNQAVQLLRACQAKFAHVNIFEDLEVREALKAYSHWPTYPQLYIKGQLIGGCDIMMNLHNKGELLTLLTQANAVQA